MENLVIKYYSKALNRNLKGILEKHIGLSLQYWNLKNSNT